MTALHVGITARKSHIAHAAWKGKKFSQKKAAALHVRVCQPNIEPGRP